MQQPCGCNEPIAFGKGSKVLGAIQATRIDSERSVDVQSACAKHYVRYTNTTLKKPPHKPHRPPERREPPAETRSGAPRLIDCLRAQGLTNREAKALLETGKVWYGGVPTADAGREVDPARVVIQRSAPRLQPNHDLAVIYR